MDSNLEILVEELKKIKENNSNFNQTHSEIISFIRALIAAIDNSIVDPFCDFTY